MAITFGMSTSDFWEEEPTMMWAYQKSYIDKKKIEAETSNFNAWLQGVYFFQAVSISLYNNLGRNKSTIKTYPKEPYNLFKDPEELRKEEILETEAKIRERNREIAKLLKEQKQKAEGKEQVRE